MPSLHAVSLSSNIARNTSGSGVVPPALLDEKKIPKFYQDAISLCGAFTANQLPNTNKVYNLMITSNLSRAVLGNIWSLVNRTKPGQLTRQEFYSCLALIALAQKGESLEALCGVSSLPIPSLQSFTVSSVVPTKAKTKNKEKDIKPVVDSVPPQFSTRVSSVQSSKIVDANALLVDLNSSSVSQGKSGKALNKLPCVEDLFASGPFNEPTEDGLPASTSKNGLSSGDFIDFDFVSKTVETLPSSQDTNVLDESQKLLERITVWDECLAQAHSIYSQAQHLILNAQALEIAQVQEVLRETHRGHQYQQSLQAIHAVVRRIGGAIQQQSSCLTQTYPQMQLNLSSQLKAVEQMWDKFNQYLSPDPSNAENLPNNLSLSCCCNICLQLVDGDSIEFVSHLYHAGCANFYINRVGPLLPKLL